jgi:cytochrome c-type biogenesis protein CcmF
VSDLGYSALLLALVVAAVGVGGGIFAGVRRRPDWTRVSERCVILLFACASLAMLALFSAFANHDFQLQYVASHSARSMTLPYRLAALWGGQAGSLLLWMWMLTAYGACAVWVSRRSTRPSSWCSSSS